MIHELWWRDVDPSTHAFDPALARAIAEAHVLWAVGGDRRLKGPLGGRKRGAVQAAIHRELLGAYGAWAAGWRWAASEPGGGGPVRGWCCAADSLFRKGDADAMASVDRVVAALVEWRAFLVEIAGIFEGLRAEAAALPVARAAERAASHLLTLIVERTSAEDAWYATFAQVVSWYLESAGFEPALVRPAISELVSGRFQSWLAPDADLAALACGDIGREVERIAEGGADEAPVDALAAWSSSRTRGLDDVLHRAPGAPTAADGHRRFIEDLEAARDPVRAARMLRALEACRTAALGDEPLTFDQLASWQAIVLDQPGVGFRDMDAWAKGGRERYSFEGDTRARFEAALAEASVATRPVAERAARVYLDVAFFHPFPDGNARAARLALDHVLTRAGLTLLGAEPVFVVARAADDPRVLLSLALLVEQLAAPRAR